MSSGKFNEFLGQYKDEVCIASLVFLVYLFLHIALQRLDLMAYDLYTYTSFAEHYAENWFYTVIPGQAHGLEIVSYPPLLFHVMALLSFIPFVGQNGLAVFLMSGAVTAFSFSFYSLVREVLDLEGRRYKLIILLIAFSPGLLKFSLVHGQLPFIVGMIFGFQATRLFYSTIKGGSARVYLAITLSLTAYIHHFSLLVTAILLVVVSLINFDHTVSRIDHLIPPIALSGLVAFIGLYPVIQETLFGISQGVISHGSRDPLRNISVFHQYITSTYGLSVLGLGVVLKKYERLHLINLLALVFMTIGLGLVTPTAEILFGDMYDFLVYDRFSLISSLFLTAIIGFYLTEYRPRIRGKDIYRGLTAILILASLATVFWANNIHLGSYTGYGDYDRNQTQTAIEFLNEEASDDYLYATAGHGAPVGEIRRNTDVPAIDTGYFQGRKYGFFESWGKLDRLERARFEQLIRRSNNLSIRYVFTFNEWSNSWFAGTEWERTRLDQGVSVWINPDAPEYQPDLGEKHVLFSMMPMMVLIGSVAVLLSQSMKSKIEYLFDSFRDILIRSAEHSSNRIFVLAFPLFAAAPSFLTSGYPAGIDTPAHIFKPELMAQMIENYGRTFFWTNQWYNGYPFMSMYPPLSTHLIYYIDTVLNNITIAYNIVRLAALSSLSAVMYLLAGNITEDRRLRLLTSAFVVFSYPLYSNLYTVGRVASAIALPLYLFLIHILLRGDIFREKVSRGHLFLGLSAGILFLMHSMMAYLFVFTGLIFCWVYRDRVVEIGIKPALVTCGVPLLLATPYLARLLQHFSVTDPYWHIGSQPLDIAGHLKHSFNVIPPTYTGWLQTAFFSIGVIKQIRSKDRFFRFLLYNFAFFYLAFWTRNFRVAFFLPLSRQFDLARFEVLFVVFGILLAVYGLRYVFEKYLSDIQQWRKTLLAVIFVLFLVIETAPMLTQSANWEPEFKEELDEIELEEGYRAMGVDMRQWHTYILHEVGVMNTFGWFNQANPNPLYTQSLQRSGGRWHGWYFVQDISDSDYRANLMELSNTKYVISAEGEWMDPTRLYQVKGGDGLNHKYNEQFVEDLQEDSEYSRNYDFEHLDVYELDREMSYCEGVKPVWIQSDYRRNAEDLLARDRMLPQIPVKGPERGGGRASNVTCNRQNPYTISVEVEENGWVLVKESYYPFWERRNEGRIHDGFGFMVLYVEEEATLKYHPRNISTLSREDISDVFS